MNEQPDFFDKVPIQEKAHRIAALISGYIHKAITPSELDELDAWVGESDENMQLFEELTDDKATQQALDWLADADGPRMLKKLKGQLEFNYVRKSMFSRSWQYGIAACIILLLGIAGFAYYKYTGNAEPGVKPQLAVEEKKDLQPGRDQAILTLADGSTIVLDEAKDGTLAAEGNSEVTKENGQLKYNTRTGSTTASIIYNTVTTPRGGSYPLTLSDGTRLWLNAASSVTFPTAFTGSERRVVITGEAYFEVRSARKSALDSDRLPFIVEIKDKGTQIEVLGTHFNINSYNDEPTIKTTLLEGAVKVSKEGKISMLKPGQQATVTDAAEIKISNNVDTDEVMAWKDGKFRFKNDNIQTIMRQISRWYDVDIEYVGQITSARYNCALDRNIPVSTVFAVLEETGGVHFKIEDKKIKVLP